MKNNAFAVLLLAASAAFALNAPEIEADLILDYMNFSGDSLYNSQGVYTEEMNRFRIRKVAVCVKGSAGEMVTYEAEAAMASCTGGTTLSVMEAGVFVEPENSPVRVGIGQLHAMRGFSMGEECGHSLMLEKPSWKNTVAPACHSLGGVMEFSFPIGRAGDISGQLGCFNGTTGSVDEDWDAVGWLQYDTPLQGLSLGGFVEKMHLEMDPQSEGIEEADRFGVGLNMDDGALFGRVEYVAVKGIPMISRPSGCQEICTNMENAGLLVQAGYSFNPGLTWATAIRPYAGYDQWDRWSNADEGDWKYSWMEAGVQVNLEPESWVTLAWRSPAGTPEDQPEDSSLLVLRMGTKI